MPTWHEVKQADLPLIALHLSKSPDFDHFYDLLVSSLKILNKYDRLADRIGADEKAFLDELKVVRVRMEQMPIGERVTGDRPRQKTSTRPLPSLPPPTPPRCPRPHNFMMPSRSAEPVSGLPQQHLRRPTDVRTPPSEQVSLPSIWIMDPIRWCTTSARSRCLQNSTRARPKFSLFCSHILH